MEPKASLFEHRTIYYYYLIIYALKKWFKEKKDLSNVKTKERKIHDQTEWTKKKHLQTKIKIWM